MVRNIILSILTGIVLVGCEKDDFKWNLPEIVRFPIVNTISAVNISNTGATIHSELEYDGGSSATIRGICWSSNQNPTIEDSNTTNGNGVGSYISFITGLNPGTIYFVRSYATNSAGTYYGNQINFTTTNFSGSVPSISTHQASNLTDNSAVSGGTVSSDGGSSVTQRGVCFSISQNPTLNNAVIYNGTGIGSFTSSISGLTPNTTYYVKAFASNAIGTAYGNQISFATENEVSSIPTLTTYIATGITANSAFSGGNVTYDGGSSVVQRGVCWNTNPNPTISDNTTDNGTGIGAFTSTIPNLNGNTTYYVRAYATNDAGTAYGNQVTFTTLSPAATLAGSNNCSSLTGVSSSYTYWNGVNYASTSWTVSGNGYEGSCWAADMTGVGGTGPVGSHYIQFTRYFSNNGYITFWLNTYYPGNNNVFPVIYIDGNAQETPQMIGGQASSFYFMQVQSENISAGVHTIKILFNCNYANIYLDEVKFYEY
jgi:hypothetical protein